MKRAAFRLLVAALGLGLSFAGHAQYYSSLRGQLNAYISLVEEQCKRIGPRLAEEAQGDEYKGMMARRAQWILCQCQPEKARALLARLSDEELAEQLLEEADLLAKVKPHVIDPCMGELMRSTYTGKDCAAMAAQPGARIDGERFCPCMERELEAYSDADAAAIGLEAADWIPAAAAAKKAQQPLPPRSAILERFAKSAEKCGAPGLLAQ